MLLTDQIEDQNRKQCQQIGGKCQIISLFQTVSGKFSCASWKCISASWAWHNYKSVSITSFHVTKCCQNCNCRMHWFHDWENNLPICFPCHSHHPPQAASSQCQRDICKISGIKQYIHRHIEYNIQNNNSCPICQSHLRRLFYNRHHQNCKCTNIPLTT